MSLPLILQEDARIEYDEAGDWYEARRVGTGAKFTAAVDSVLRAITRQPRMHAVVYGDLRRAVVRGFPYCVYYRADATEVVVVSVFHTSRDPSIWQGRA